MLSQRPPPLLLSSLSPLPQSPAVISKVWLYAIVHKRRRKVPNTWLVDLIKTHWDLSKLCANQQEVDCPSSCNTEPILQSTKARASSLLEPAMKVSLDAEPMGRECSWCWVLLKPSGKGKSRLPPIQISPVLRHVDENIFLPTKKKHDETRFVVYLYR